MKVAEAQFTTHASSVRSFASPHEFSRITGSVDLSFLSDTDFGHMDLLCLVVDGLRAGR